LPALAPGLPQVEALARAARGRRPVLEEDAVAEHELDVRLAERVALGVDDIPVADPEIELARLGVVLARILRRLDGVIGLLPARIAPQRDEVVVGLHLRRQRAAQLGDLAEPAERRVLVAEARVAAGELIARHHRSVAGLERLLPA